MCHCGRGVELTSRSLLHCPTFSTERQILLSTPKDIDEKFLENTDPILANIFLFGEVTFDRASST